MAATLVEHETVDRNSKRTRIPRRRGVDPEIEIVEGDDWRTPPPHDEPRSRSSGRPGRKFVTVVASLTVITTLAWGLGHWGGSPPTRDDVLVRTESGVVALLDPASGATVFEVPEAVVAPDRSSLLSTRTTGDGEQTTLESRDPNTGDVTGSTTLPGELDIRVVSPEGGAVALMAPRADGDVLYEPQSRLTTEITVAFTDDRASQSFELAGNFEPETFSLDEKTMYLLEFEPADAPEFYFVREMDLATGAIESVKSPQVDLQPEMRGVAREQALHPNGDLMFTLYSIPGDSNPVHEGTVTDGSARWAFVHVLDLKNGTDFCIFLPPPIGEVNEATVGLGLSPDGRTLIVADPASAMVARIDTQRLEIVDLFEVPEIADPQQRADVAIADDGTVYIGVGRVIHEFEPGAFERIHVWDTGSEANGLTISATGEQLRFAAGGHVHLVDRTSRATVATLTGPGDSDEESIEILGPPNGAVVSIPLECAC